MQHENINFKKRGGRSRRSILWRSSHNFANRLWRTSAHREQASADTMHVGAKSLRRSSLRASTQKNSSERGFSLASYAVRTRRSLEKSSYSKIAGWSLVALAVFGTFGYLTFIPEQAFAAYDWEQRTLSDIDTMQEMNAKICENSEIGESKQLEDTRDRVNGQAGTGKKYWVTKLKGDTDGTKEKGECWMTQNLDFDLSTSKTLTPADSDVTANWTPDNSTITGNINSVWSNENAKVQSWDPRNYYYKHVSVTDWTSCGNSSAQANLSDCTTNWTITAPVEGEHYHVGNYYSWNAATAGTGGEIKEGQASSSICPKGWRLPAGSGITADFGILMSAYGLRTDNGAEDDVDKVSLYPLYFIPAGNVSTDGLYYAGYYGYYWSSTPHSNGTYAYNLYFYPDHFASSNGDNRYYGGSVRCVAADVYPEKPPITDNDTANVAITVSPVISIDVTKDANDMTVDFTKVATSTIVARVGSNQPYKVMLSTDKSDLTNPKTNQTIPMIPSDQTIVKGTSSWGIKKLFSPTDTTVNENTKYSPVGINGEKALFYTSASAASEDLTFPVAIAVDSSLPSGQYSTQVTLTAVAM